MTYRKFKADHLFTGREMKEGEYVLITAEDGVVQAIVPAADAGTEVERFDGMLSPGFVNCHCHLELSHLKGRIPERTGLVDFLLAVIRERAVPQGEPDPGTDRVSAAINAAITGAEESMLQNGIIAVGDVCNTTDSLLQKTEGRLYYHNFIEAIGFAEAGVLQRFESSRAIFHAFAQAYPLPIEANSLTPHAPYSVAPGLFRLIAGFPGNHLLTIHNQESEAENEFYRTGTGEFLKLYAALGLDTSFFQGTGKNSLESYLPHFYPNQSLILVHNIATGEDDLRFALSRKAKGPNLFFCLCPNANLYISGQLPDLGLLMEQDCTIVLGTDSLASNHQLSILEEAKTLQRQFPQLPTATLLQWATFNGARALQLDNVLGSFEPGRQPGVVLIGNMEGERFGAAAQARRLL